MPIQPTPRLAIAVRERMTELRMKQNEVDAAGGPSGVTLRKVLGAEHKPQDPIAATTLGALDIALRWEPGTAEDILRGGEARPLPPALTVVETHDPEVGHVLLALPLDPRKLNPVDLDEATAVAKAAFLQRLRESGALDD